MYVCTGVCGVELCGVCGVELCGVCVMVHVWSGVVWCMCVLVCVEWSCVVCV